MSQRLTTDEYHERWHQHVEQLEKLGWHLDAEQKDVLEDTLGQLGKLVDVAAEQREADRE